MIRSASLAGAAALAILIVGAAAAEDVRFGPGAEHPWNRLHRLLYVRTQPDGKEYLYEGLEAPLGREGPFLLEGPSHRQALELLDEFLRTDADRLVEDPFRRALLQRDLWCVFDKTAELMLSSSYRAYPEDRQRPRRDLQKRLAQVMRRLELSSHAIDALPDNYAAAVKSGAFPRDFDPEHPDRAFLPPDLLAADGPWVPVRPSQQHPQYLPAPQHTVFTEGRSVFSVLLRLPGGRKATEQYVADLRPDRGARPIPPGTQVALVRRLVLVNDQGALQVTPLTEEVQLRAFPTPKDQHFYEVALDRNRLLAGKSGGLRALGREDEDLFFFQSMAGFRDPFQHEGGMGGVIRPLTHCAACHETKPGGIFTLQTFVVGTSGGQERFRGGEQTTYAEQVWRTMLYRRETYSWGLLQGLRETTPGK
jgi:hypothetical protein